MSDAGRCAQCGALIAMVGLRHRCVAVARPEPSPVRAERKPQRPSREGEGGTRVQRWRAAHRDQYRAYMRDYMLAYRARKRAKASGGAVEVTHG